MSLILVGIIAVVVLAFLGILASSYKKVSSNEALVVWGAGIKDGYKIKKGGASFVIPGLQQSKTLSFSPMVVSVNMEDARSKENVQVRIETVFTLSIGRSDELLRVAAQKLLDLGPDQITSQCREIIEGQLRAIIVNMTLDELNTSRKSFEEQIANNTAVELAKLGLELTNNPNIKSITDEGDYFISRGTKASVEAKSAMSIDIAEATKSGEIGTKLAEREQEIKIAELDKDQAVQTANFQTEKEIGMAEAKKNQEIKTAEYGAEERLGIANAAKEQAIQEAKYNTEKQIAVAEANKDQEVKTAELQAEQIKGQNISKTIAAESEKEYQVKQAEFTRQSKTAEIKAETEIQKLNAERELEELRANEVAKVRAEKEKIELNAEAEKIKAVKAAEAEAEKILLKAKAEAEGIEAIMSAKNEGYKNLVDAVGRDNVVNVMLTEQIVEVTEVKAKAIAGINIDKITVWDNPSSGSDSGVTGLVDRIQNSVGMHELAREAGINYPDWMGSIDKDGDIAKNLSNTPDVSNASIEVIPDDIIPEVLEPTVEEEVA